MKDAPVKLESSDYLQAESHEPSRGIQGHASGYKPKRMKTRIGILQFQVPFVVCLFLGALLGCKSSAWHPGPTGATSEWRGREVREAAGQLFLIGERANADKLLGRVRRTSDAYRLLVGQDPPRGLVLVIDEQEEVPLESAYAWFEAAAIGKDLALGNQPPSKDAIRKRWQAETERVLGPLPDEGTQRVRLFQSQRYWVVKAPLATRGPFFADLLGLPADLESGIAWGLLAPSDGLSDSVADELLALSMAVQNSSAAERVGIRLFRGKLRSQVLRETHLMMQLELFSTWISLAGMDSSTALGSIKTFIDELAQS